MAGKVFTSFDFNSDVVQNQKTIVTSGIFTNNQGSLSTAFTGSLQTSSSKAYYYDVYDSTSSSAEAQFAVAYGHRLGSGSATSGQANDGASRAIYSQYRALLLNPGDTTFTFANSVSSDAIYVINFNRSKLKDRLDPGNWQLSLAELSGSSVANSAHTGSNVKVSGTGRVVTLIDDSGLTNQTPTLTKAGRVYNIVSGSITNGIYKYGTSGDTIYYGLVYPDMGIIILNARPDAVYSTGASGLSTNSIGFNSVSGSGVNGDNAWKLFTSISGAFAINSTTNAFYARNEETISSTHYFVRVKNAEYNFSNNPTFVTGSNGQIAQATFIKDPKVYLTTIGLYNDRQELLAVAKLSKPIQKSFSKEALVKVKLDF